MTSDMSGSDRRYVFTISPGRSGQASLAAILQECVPSAFVAFEEPQVNPFLPGLMGDMERRLRRRFIETDELLGRGRVLSAFDSGDRDALLRFAKDRLRWLNRQMARRRADIYIDISKHMLHGLHVHTFGLLDGPVRFIRLIRDPVANMRSYLNRRKRFELDYGRIDGPNNELILDPHELEEGERYLFAWCETYLRGERLIRELGTSPPVDIATENLSDPAAVTALLTALELPYQTIEAKPAQNTNIASGYGKTCVTADDLALFKRFKERLSPQILQRLPPAMTRRADGSDAA